MLEYPSKAEQRAYRLRAEDRIGIFEAAKIIHNKWLLQELVVPDKKER